jgi:phosphatidylcholine synthase
MTALKARAKLTAARRPPGRAALRAKLTVISENVTKKPRENGMTWLETVKYFSIHVLTASGAAWAFLALIAAADQAWDEMFLWLGIALLVDAIDGPLARRTNIAEKLPRWSGDILDLVIDFLTYVFVPAYAIAVCGLLPEKIALVSAVAIVMTSALYFSDNKMKMHDNYFRGFPAIWNVAVFYLLLIAPPPALAVLFVAVFMVMTFLPIPFIHPMRVKRLRRVNLALLGLWSGLALIAIHNNMAAGTVVTGTLCLLGLYIVGGGLLRRPEVTSPS